MPFLFLPEAQAAASSSIMRTHMGLRAARDFNVKPPPITPFSPSQVAPEWRWFWSDPWGVWPFWERGGDDIYDISGNGNHGTILNFSPERWQSTRYGIGYGVTPEVGNAEVVEVPSTPFGGTDPCSFIWCGRVEELNDSLWAMAEATEILIRIQPTGEAGFVLNSFSTNDRAETPTGVVSVGDFILLTGTYDGATLSVYVTVLGGATTTASVTPTGTYANNASTLYIGRRNSIVNGIDDNTTLFAAVLRHGITVSQHIQLAEDPFGPIRMRSSLLVNVSAPEVDLGLISQGLHPISSGVATGGSGTLGLPQGLHHISEGIVP